MSIVKEIKQLIFQEAFYGSLFCRFNQGQLECKPIRYVSKLNYILALSCLNEQIFADLVQLLMVKQEGVQVQYRPVNPIHPCWIDSQVESHLAFEQIVEKLKQWFKDMAIQIYNFREKNSLYWVRLSGTLIVHNIFFTNLVKTTLRINKIKTAIAECLDEALKQLESDGKICTEYSCICQQQYPNCPLMEIVE